MIDWYRLPGRKGLPLILINAMARSSVKLTVANFIELSLSTFGSVSKTLFIKFVHKSYYLCVVYPNRWLIHRLPT